MIMVNKNSDIETLDDLAGKVVGVQTATSAYDLLNDEEGQADLCKTFKSLEVYETYTIAFNDLKAGAVDALAIDVTSGNFLMSGEDDYKFLDEVELRDKVNAALEALVEDGTYDKIGQKYPEIYDFLCLGK
jgi:polar amino acid transport system substrate-binding protein